MNFRTTITLLVVLGVIGLFLFLTRPASSPNTSPTSAADARKVIDLKTEDVTRFSIAPRDGKPTTFEKAGGEWKITEPIDAKADTFAVDGLLRDIIGVESQGNIDPSQKAANGLDHPAYTVTLTTKDKTEKFLVGDKPPVGNTLGVMLDGQDKIEVADASLVAKLDKKPSTYRKTKLIDATTEQIRQLQITRGKETIRLEKSGSDWKIISPNAMPGDSTAIENVLFAITSLSAVSFDDQGLSTADAGLTSPRATVWFSTEAPSSQPTTASTSKPAGTTIKFGGFEDVSDKNLYVSVDDGPIARVAASSYDSFKKTPLDLRDKTVLNIDPDRVESFTLNIEHPVASPASNPTTAPTALSVQRRKQDRTLGPSLPPTTQAATQPTTAPSATQPSSKWTLASGEAANDDAVKAVLDALHPLKAEKFLEKPAATQPAATYTLTVQAGPGAGASGSTETLKLVDPGKDQKLIGSSGELTFELDRAILTSLDANFAAKK